MKRLDREPWKGDCTAWSDKIYATYFMLPLYFQSTSIMVTKKKKNEARNGVKRHLIYFRWLHMMQN